MMAKSVGLRGQPLAILDRNARYTGLNLCIRGDDNAHNPESPRGDRGNGPETSAKRSPIELKWEEISFNKRCKT